MSFTINVVRNSDGTVVRTLNVSDAKVKALKDSLLGDSGILEWITGAINGKIHNCAKRLKNAWLNTLISEGTIIPDTDEGFIALVTSRSDYKDRETRDTEELAAKEARFGGTE